VHTFDPSDLNAIRAWKGAHPTSPAYMRGLPAWMWQPAVRRRLRARRILST